MKKILIVDDEPTILMTMSHVLLSYVKQISPKTNVIIMTAYGSDEMREEAYKRGAFQYFEKPIDIPHLIERVQSMGIESVAEGLKA
jgi:DNA-binding NtrC family response regulator